MKNYDIWIPNCLIGKKKKNQKIKQAERSGLPRKPAHNMVSDASAAHLINHGAITHQHTSTPKSCVFCSESALGCCVICDSAFCRVELRTGNIPAARIMCRISLLLVTLETRFFFFTTIQTHCDFVLHVERQKKSQNEHKPLCIYAK